MVVRVIAHLKINENEPRALAEYLKVTMPLLNAAGAKIKHRFQATEQVIGGGGLGTIVVVEYPDRQSVEAVFNSPEYENVKQVRDIAFASYEISICDSEDFAEASKDQRSIN